MQTGLHCHKIKLSHCDIKLPQHQVNVDKAPPGGGEGGGGEQRSIHDS